MKKDMYVRTMSIYGTPLVVEVDVGTGHARILDPRMGYKCIARLNENIPDAKQFELELRKLGRAALQMEKLQKRQEELLKTCALSPDVHPAGRDEGEQMLDVVGPAPRKTSKPAGKIAPWKKRSR